MGIKKEKDRLTIIINKEVKAKLQEIAEGDNRSMSNYIADLLEKHAKEKSL